MTYYEILGVPSHATPYELKQAYRRQAQRCHPDRGGSHEKMLQLNEAWGILSNELTRRHYDDAQAHANDQNAQEASRAESGRERERAGEYPRRWSDFETWMNAFYRDFTDTTYGSVDLGRYEWPTAGKSFSGWLFILGGAAAGFGIAAAAYALLFWGDRPESAGAKGTLFLLILSLWGGSSYGRDLHERLGDCLKERREAGMRFPLRSLLRSPLVWLGLLRVGLICLIGAGLFTVLAMLAVSAMGAKDGSFFLRLGALAGLAIGGWLGLKANKLLDRWLARHPAPTAKPDDLEAGRCEQALHWLVIAQIGIGLTTLAVAPFAKRNLPPLLKEFHAAELASSSWSNTYLEIFYAIFLACLIASLIGLLRKWRIAPTLFTGVFIASTLCDILGHPSVQVPIHVLLSDLDTASAGAILCLVYFSKVRSLFTRDASTGVARVSVP